MKQENTFKELVEILKQHKELVTEKGALLKNKVQELVLKNDKKIIELLLNNYKLKKLFFYKIGEILIFDKDKFIGLVYSKNFLADSYTKFSTSVGLASGDEYINARNDVVLNWPHKDCILEGGMTKEDEKRDEIFWNEIIAPEHVTRLESPKAFINGSRINAEGEQLVKDFNRSSDGTIKDNLIIKGNNLLALYSLQKQFAGKVKLIYIDPPYNTGNDSFLYFDNFNRSSWLTFMKNRIEIARQLLQEDGIIVIQCDDNEQAYLRVIMDEVFDPSNFIAVMAVQTNPRGRSLDENVAKTFEFLNVYSKSQGKGGVYKVAKTEKQLAEYRFSDEIGEYRPMRLMNGNRFFNKETRANLWYPIYANPENGKVSLKKDNNFSIEIFPINSSGRNQCWTWGKEKFEKESNLLFAEKKSNNEWRVYRKDYKEGESLLTKPKGLWVDKGINHEQGTEHLRNIGLEFTYAKSEYLMMKILKIFTKENDIVLDFCLGSGTTASAAHKMSRQYIGVEQMDYVKGIACERLKKVITGEQGGISEEVQWKGGGDFVYLELAKWNQEWVEKIKKVESAKEIFALWGALQEKAFLSYKVDIEKINANAKDFKDLSLQDQKKFLLDSLDANHLYINHSELEDDDYGLSSSNKDISKKFYKD